MSILKEAESKNRAVVGTFAKKNKQRKKSLYKNKSATAALIFLGERKMTREEVLEAAKKCVCGDREQDYGVPEKNFETIGYFWQVYLLSKFSQTNVTFVLEAHDVAAMLALMKIARISSGHAKEDNWIDLAGYAACGAEVQSND